MLRGAFLKILIVKIAILNIRLYLNMCLTNTEFICVWDEVEIVICSFFKSKIACSCILPIFVMACLFLRALC